MNAKLSSARAWALILMILFTGASLLLGQKPPTEWWVLLGIVIRDYFGRRDRKAEET